MNILFLELDQFKVETILMLAIDFLTILRAT